MKDCPDGNHLYLFIASFPNKIFMRQENIKGNIWISPHKRAVVKKKKKEKKIISMLQYIFYLCCEF